MSGLMIGALMALSLVQQTDTVIALDGATGLDVENTGGRIFVTTWDRPEIRIQADHSRRSFVEIRRRRSGVPCQRHTPEEGRRPQGTQSVGVV